VTIVKRLYVMLCGYETLPRTVCTRGSGAEFVMSLPISAYLMETTKGFVLFDCGINADVLRDPALRHRYYTAVGTDPAPVVWAQHEMKRYFSAIGVGFDDVSDVILSHLHIDHAGNLQRCRKARFWVQKDEHAHAFAAVTPPAYLKDDYALPDADWRIIEGDHVLADGIKILSTPGHTPGHQSALIELPKSGPALLVADVGDLMENFNQEILPGQASDDAKALASIRKINRIRAERNATMFLCHDPNLIQTTRLAPDYYD
jgi:N-acyl homoserine lactone hydrolase